MGDDEERSTEQLRLLSLDGVLGALFRLMRDDMGIYEEDPDHEGITAIDVAHALLPNPCTMVEEVETKRQEMLGRLDYIGPLREQPSRHYMYSGLSWPAVGKSGANLPEMLLSDERILAELNEALEGVQAGYQVAAVRSEGPGAQGLFWLRLTDPQTGVAVSPTDVGLVWARYFQSSPNSWYQGIGSCSSSSLRFTCIPARSAVSAIRTSIRLMGAQPPQI
ncbi:MAG: hypothetical protein JXA87_14875 [Thermoleophilia bacterium]|nr:hypothetical protein [Thermoleophilia bacterium]